MHAHLTRAILFAKKCGQAGLHAIQIFRKYLVLARDRTSSLIRQNAPILRQYLEIRARLAWQFTSRVVRLCLEHALRFTHRVIFMVTVLCIRIAELLRHYLPIIRQYASRIWRSSLDHTARFTYRIIFMTSVLCIRVAELLRHYTPIVINDIRSRAQRAGQAASTIYHIALVSTVQGIRRLVFIIIAVSSLVFRLATKITRATAGIINRAVTLFSKSLLALLLAVVSSLLIFWATSITFCRYCLHHAWRITGILLRNFQTISVRAGERVYQYALLIRLNKPIGIFLLLWPTMWALWIAADGTPDLPILLIFIGGVVLMRSAGCIINDLADRNFDPHISRTQQRPLATGKVTSKEALVVAAVLVLCAFLLVLQLNRMTIGLSVIGILLAIIYPFTKRYTYMPQLFLGLAFGWAVPMAFAAQTGTVPAMGWILLMATVLWALVYDTMYAMVDRDEDIQLGIKSTAILFEDADRIIIGIIQALVLLTLLLIGSRLDFNRYYYAGLAIAALLFIYQQHLIRDRSPQQCFMAFQNNNWFGAMVFGGILMNYQYG